MYVKILNVSDNWQDIKNTAMTTIGKSVGKYPTSEWKRKIIMSEHSMIRKLKFSAKWYDLKSFVSTHICRHKYGIEHWVRTQRSDRTGIDRNKLPQDNPVEHEIEANAQAIINISRKRLCFQASKETREAWQSFLDSFKDEQPELYSSCVKDCVYKNGFCSEFKSCKYNQSSEFLRELMKYQQGFEDQINSQLVVTPGKVRTNSLDKVLSSYKEYENNTTKTITLKDFIDILDDCEYIRLKDEQYRTLYDDWLSAEYTPEIEKYKECKINSLQTLQSSNDRFTVLELRIKTNIDK